MSPEKARWMLSVAMFKYQEGDRLLVVYKSILDQKNRQQLLDTRERFRLVIDATVERLTNETVA